MKKARAFRLFVYAIKRVDGQKMAINTHLSVSNQATYDAVCQLVETKSLGTLGKSRYVVSAVNCPSFRYGPADEFPAPMSVSLFDCVCDDDMTKVYWHRYTLYADLVAFYKLVLSTLSESEAGNVRLIERRIAELHRDTSRVANCPTPKPMAWELLPYSFKLYGRSALDKSSAGASSEEK